MIEAVAIATAVLAAISDGTRSDEMPGWAKELGLVRYSRGEKRMMLALNQVVGPWTDNTLRGVQVSDMDEAKRRAMEDFARFKDKLISTSFFYYPVDPPGQSHHYAMQAFDPGILVKPIRVGGWDPNPTNTLLRVHWKLRLVEYHPDVDYPETIRHGPFAGQVQFWLSYEVRR